MARSNRFSATPISSSTGRETAMPIPPPNTPKITLMRSEVCTARSTPSSSLAPICRATTTLAPTEKPINMFSTRLINAPVVLMAPTEFGSCERLTTIISAAL